MSDLDGDLRFIVCRAKNPAANESQYEIRTLFGNETWSQQTTEAGASETVIYRNSSEGTYKVDVAGEFCGEFTDRGQARIEASRLQKLLEVMES